MNDTAPLAPEILFDRRGGLGHMLLNRPKALNALTLGMCELMFPQLRAWRLDSSVKAVIIRGAGEKAFCAGGDVVRLYEDGRAKRPYPYQFWRTEYRLNTYIKRYAKPYIAFIDGIVMGGGVGVSQHGSHRVATDRTTFAMPETGIGLFPDVGGSYFLPRLPGATGAYLGLTGRRLKGPDCVALGLADAFVRHDRLDALEQELAAKATSDSGEIAQIIDSYAEQVKDAPILTERAAMDKHFSHATVEAIIASLKADDSEWAKAQLATLAPKSPLSMKVTLRQIRAGAKLSFEDCMRMEWRMANRFAVGHEFYEGVRALLVDKDNKPQWLPATLEGVTDADLDAIFAPLASDELDLSDITREA